jgi:putative membrane protein
MHLLARFLGTVFAVLLAAYVVPGFVVSSFYTAAIVALILGVLNITIKPLLLLLTLPINLLTFGLFTLVINAFLLWFIATFVSGFTVAGFVPALLGGLIIAVVGWILHELT